MIFVDQYPPYCKTEEDRQRYRDAVARLPSYDEMLEMVIEPPAEWLAEKWESVGSDRTRAEY